MARSSSNAVREEGARKTRSKSSKEANSHKNEQLNTPPPDAGTADNHPDPKGDTDNNPPTEEVEKTPGKPSDHVKPPTLTPLSVDAQIPASPVSNHGKDGDMHDTDHDSEDDSDYASDNEEDYEELYSGRTTYPSNATGT
jgi:hypothetical protein